MAHWSEARKTSNPEGMRGSAPTPGTTRRQALQMGVAATAASLGFSGCKVARGRETLARQDGSRAGDEALDPIARQDGSGAGDEALDHALRWLHDREPLSKQGLSTHAPMVAEALCSLGYADRAVSWVENYAAPLIEIPRPTKRIERDDWRAALGPRPDASTWEAALARWGDWKEFFNAELAEASWQDVLDRWVARLAPGLCAAATHGVIRTGHAARALSRRETPERRGELARGLAYWAAAYEVLPARERSSGRVATYAEGLDQVPLYWERHGRAPTGNIVNGLRQIKELDRFAEVRDLVAPKEDLAAGLSSLTATFARVYLQHGTRNNTIAFVHAVTGPCALRRIAPHVKPETAAAALPYAWQAAAAIHAAYARKDNKPQAPEPKLSPAELAARAVENGADHAIKFTEVLLAERELNPDPVYLAAAQDAVLRL
jgi:hypothetical protein